MGFRTVVVLYNDQNSTWATDPDLGSKISYAMGDQDGRETDLGYGRVVQCTHADLQTLAVFDSYNMTPIAHGLWHPASTPETTALSLLRTAAEKFGYVLHKKKSK